MFFLTLKWVNRALRVTPILSNFISQNHFTYLFSLWVTFRYVILEITPINIVCFVFAEFYASKTIFNRKQSSIKHNGSTLWFFVINIMRRDDGFALKFEICQMNAVASSKSWYFYESKNLTRRILTNRFSMPGAVVDEWTISYNKNG